MDSNKAPPVSMRKFDHTYSEISVKGHKKDYPSVSDYYKASFNGTGPMQYQHGLSNSSSVQFGDDRISFTKSLSQVVFKKETGDCDCDDDGNNEADVHFVDILDTEVLKERIEAYAKATKAVSIEEVNNMERMMREKLHQRTKAGPFQLRKTFKIFDRDGSGGIDFNEFQKAMELMGFRFSEVQQLGLFARYDENCSGEVNYIDFAEKVMEADFTHTSNLDRMINSAFVFHPSDDDLNDHNHACGSEGSSEETDSDDDDEGFERFKRMEVQKLFNTIDKDGSQYIDRKEMVVLINALRKTIDKDTIEEGFKRIDIDGSGQIEFEDFYAWFNSVDSK